MPPFGRSWISTFSQNPKSSQSRATERSCENLVRSWPMPLPIRTFAWFGFDFSKSKRWIPHISSILHFGTALSRACRALCVHTYHTWLPMYLTEPELSYAPWRHKTFFAGLYCYFVRVVSHTDKDVDDVWTFFRVLGKVTEANNFTQYVLALLLLCTRTSVQWHFLVLKPNP